MLGAIAGLLVVLTKPALAIVILLALVPLSLVPVGLAGAAGAIAGRRLVTRFVGGGDQPERSVTATTSPEPELPACPGRASARSS
jgi:hypothetical protein